MEESNKGTEVDNTDKKSYISDVRSAYNGFRPNYPIFDDLEDLKRLYTPEQLQKMWEDVYPKSSEINNKIIITGTPK